MGPFLPPPAGRARGAAGPPVLPCPPGSGRGEEDGRVRAGIKALLCCANTKAKKHFPSGAFGGRRPLRSSRARRAPSRKATLEVRGQKRKKEKKKEKKSKLKGELKKKKKAKRQAPQPAGKRGGGRRAAALSSGAPGVALPPGPAWL